MSAERHRSSALAALLLGLAALCWAPALASAANVDVRGTWDFTCGGPCGPQRHTFSTEDFATGAVSGTGASYPDPSTTWTESGTVTGSHIDFTFTYDGGGYSGTASGTVAADGQAIDGTFDDGVVRPFHMNRLTAASAPATPTGLSFTPVPPSNFNNPLIHGTTDPGTSIAIFNNPACSGTAVANGSPGAGFGSGIQLAVSDNSTTTFYARAADGASNLSGCSAGATYVEQSDAAPPPEARKTANVEAKSGDVTVKCPGQAETQLQGEDQIKLGCKVDATDGVVGLTTETEKGKLQEADFYEGAFVPKQVSQTETVKGKKVTVLITELKLDVAKPTGCKTSKTGIGTAKRGGHLWGRGKGRFRTRGRRGAGTVRGTQWLTAEWCEGTYFQVKTGVVEVKDYTLKKTVSVKKGKHYLAPTTKPN